MKKASRVSLISLLLAVLLMVLPFASAFADSGYEDALNSVVRIYNEITVKASFSDFSQTYYFGAKGTGFAVGEKGKPVDHFVTNKHVVEGLSEDEQKNLISKFAQLCASLFDAETKAQCIEQYGSEEKFLSVIASNVSLEETPVVYVVFDDLDTMKETTRVIVSDKYDLACVVIPNTTDLREACQIALYDDLERTECWALGFPGLSDALIQENLEESMPSSLKYCSITQGNIQFTTETTTSGSCVQHTATINHGNSGGPLVNEKGQVLGVNTFSYGDGESSSNVAQTSSQLKQFLDSENVSATYVNLSSGVNYILIAAVAAAVIAVIAVVIVLVKKNKSDKKPSGEVRTLIVEKGTLGAGKQFVLKKGQSHKIGTTDGKCTILFPKQTPGVSHIHCTVSFDGLTVRVKDEGSTYGTYIDEQKIATGGEAVLHRGHRLAIGSQKEKFVLR